MLPIEVPPEYSIAGPIEGDETRARLRVDGLVDCFVRAPLNALLGEPIEQVGAVISHHI